MIDLKYNHILRIINFWFVYIAIVIVANFLPHWETWNFLNWFNGALYFLLFLVSIAIAKKDRNNTDIFINMAIFSFIISFSFINAFIGKGYLLGNEYLSYQCLIYKKILFSFLLNFIVIYVVLKYIFHSKKRFLIYISTFLITSVILILNFYPYLINPYHVFTLGDGYKKDLYTRLFSNQAASVIFLFIFGYRLLKKDIILGEYINPMMSFLFIYFVLNMTDIIGAKYGFQISLISKYILTFSLILLLFVLFKKLHFLYTEFGQFYESLLHGKVSLGNVSIQRRHFKSHSTAFKALKYYISQRFPVFIIFVGILPLTLFIFGFPKYVLMNFISFTFCLTVLFLFTDALYKKRAKQNHIIPGTVKTDSGGT